MQQQMQMQQEQLQLQMQHMHMHEGQPSEARAAGPLETMTMLHRTGLAMRPPPPLVYPYSPHQAAWSAPPQPAALAELQAPSRAPPPPPVQDARSWATEFASAEDNARSHVTAAAGRVDEDVSAEELRLLTRVVVDGIADPKLRSSNLVRFLTDISEGTLELRDGTVVPAGASATRASAGEYGQQADDELQHRQQLDDAAWAQEAWDDVFDADMMAAAPAPVPGSAARYEFARDNPYMQARAAPDGPSAFDAGMAHWRAGRISEAILAFEAAVQHEPAHSLGWQMLGLSHAENDKDYSAIAALERAVALDERNSDALMALAVSYTNEANRAKALEVLEHWIRMHPSYAARVDFDAVAKAARVDSMPSDPSFDDPAEAAFHAQFSSYWRASLEKHAQVSAMYLAAANAAAASGFDADVQVGLGILFNLSHEYSKAADCFAAALTSRPDDYLLWNKYGATLANSAQYAEAIGAYHSSLALNPSYVRAKVNLGISHSNRGEYAEAASHYLGALTMEPRSRAEHVWHLLRMALSMIPDREDLVRLTESGDVSLFRAHFDF